MTKKALVLFLALGLVLSLVVAGCAPESAPAPDEGEEEEAAPEEEEEEAPAAAADKVYTGTWVDCDAAGTDQNLILVEAAANMLAASNGRLDITISASGEIVPRDEGVPAVGDGVVDMCTPAASMDMGRLGPVTYILGPTGAWGQDNF